MKYTITGATGHLGREVVKELSKLTDSKNIRLAVRKKQKILQKPAMKSCTATTTMFHPW